MDISEIPLGELKSTIAEKPNVVVCYYSPKCINCKLVFYYAHHIAKDRPDVEFYKYNIDNDPEVQSNHNINMLPCIFMYKDNHIACRYFGTSEATFRSAIEKYY